ncbi:DUF4124 domain-containing protein [Acinetobacter venetianus]|uniref:DUF4124 domain-containing protein n=1 Tax=Acinetobacter venetianus TaxID=52133 RepID=UPI00241CA2E6|nr:DUF4124 domain-containing protein [Acinetobacter venetianus]
MSKSIIQIIYAFCLMSFCYSAHAQELYKCVTNQGSSYQSGPCSSKASQKIACTGSAADGFNGECESLEQRRMQAISNEKNAYTQDLASNKTKVSAKRSEFQRAMVQFPECKQRIMYMERLARYSSHPTQTLENNSRLYAARICTDDGSVYLSCNAATNTLLTQTNPTCSLKRKR